MAQKELHAVARFCTYLRAPPRLLMDLAKNLFEQVNRHRLVCVVLTCLLTLAYITLLYRMGGRLATDRLEETVAVEKQDTVAVGKQENDAVGKQEHEEKLQILRGRARKLQKRCEQLYGKHYQHKTSTEARKSNKFLVSDEYKLLFCFIPKVACSNIRRTFFVLNGLLNKTQPVNVTSYEVIVMSKQIQRLRSYSEEGVRQRLRSFTKVMFVREPFERLISAFNNQFRKEINTLLQREEAERILKLLGLKKAPEGKHLVTFANFIEYLIIQHRNNLKFNQHWETYNRLCDPCHIQYDYVGEYKTIDDEMGTILKKIGADSIHFPIREDFPQYRTTQSVELLEAYYKDIPTSQIEQLKKIYADDILLFGFKLPNALVGLLEEGRTETKRKLD